MLPQEHKTKNNRIEWGYHRYMAIQQTLLAKKPHEDCEAHYGLDGQGSENLLCYRQS